MELHDSSDRSGRFRGRGVNRSFYLPRLPREYYQGDAVVHWTLSMSMRASGWLTVSFHSAFREMMLHAASREGLLCPVYCLMPDHMHLIWMGLRLDSDQQVGMKFLRRQLAPPLFPYKFQHQPHDHVLREEERKRGAFAGVCGYILENPFRDELLPREASWVFCGAVIPGFPTLHPARDDFWPKFWRIYAEQLAPDAHKIKRPPVG